VANAKAGDDIFRDPRGTNTAGHCFISADTEHTLPLPREVVRSKPWACSRGFFLSLTGARIAAALGRTLLLVNAQDLASGRVDEVHLPAGIAAHALIGLGRIRGPLVRTPALHAVARVRESNQDGGHDLTYLAAITAWCIAAHQTLPPAGAIGRVAHGREGAVG